VNTGDKILITGGTGSFGNKFVKMALERGCFSEIIIFSRDEMKHWEMAQRFSQNSDKIRFIIGDVRDEQSLDRAFEGVDYVVHAAATKIVPLAEYNPFECIKTNIDGASNVIRAAIRHKVKKVVALSTDKASSPANLYGASKLASDKLFIASNSYSSSSRTIFSIVRYGNVMGSRGSVIPYFLSLPHRDPLPITDIRMTRFMIPLDSAVNLVFKAFDDMRGGEIYVKKIPSMKVVDLAEALFPGREIEVIGIRPGEKLHEQMIGEEDASSTFSYDGYYKILPQINNWDKDYDRIRGGLPVGEDFYYSSENNDEWMMREELKLWFDNNQDDIGKI